MCLIAIAYQVHPDFPFLCAANRDEFYERPTEKAHFWSTSSLLNRKDENNDNLVIDDVVAGKDLVGGGTWLGLTKAGRFAAITNYRKASDPLNPNDEIRKSRGPLVSNFLLSNNISAEEYITQISSNNDAQRYFDGFNLLLGDASGLYYYSNRNNDDTNGGIQKLQPGHIYALCNRLLDDPWPKVRKVKKEFAAILGDLNTTTAATAGSALNEQLFHLLHDKSKPPFDELPIQDTGCTQEIEELLSSIFIESDFYGTRCSTVITISRSASCCFEERSFGKHGEYLETVNETFQVTAIPGLEGSIEIGPVPEKKPNAKQNFFEGGQSTSLPSIR